MSPTSLCSFAHLCCRSSWRKAASGCISTWLIPCTMASAGRATVWRCCTTWPSDWCKGTHSRITNITMRYWNEFLRFTQRSCDGKAQAEAHYSHTRHSPQRPVVRRAIDCLTRPLVEPALLLLRQWMREGTRHLLVRNRLRPFQSLFYTVENLDGVSADAFFLNLI